MIQAPSYVPDEPRPPAATGGAAWPRFVSDPYMRWFDPDEWTCWHLVRAFYLRELGIELPTYGVAAWWPGMDDSAAFAGALDSGSWTPATTPRFGDVTAFSRSEGDHHVGVVVQPLRMLHVILGANTEITRYDSPNWLPMLSGIYRWTPST